jgi:hypothetical protein
MRHACLHTICFVFCYTSWHFYSFSGTNLLMRCHSASSLFSAVLGFSEKLHRKYSQNWTKQKPNLLFFPKGHKVQRWDGGGARGQAHPRVARPTPGPRHLGLRPAGPPPDAALPPIYSPQREKPKGRIAFPQNILQATAVVDARSGGSRSSSWHPPERGIPAGGLLHHHGRLRSDVWVVYLGLRVHSSS